MIVATSELAAVGPRVTLVDGGFDPIHPGHIQYFEEAAKLGLPVLCNISGDDWVSRKHRPLLAQHDRGSVIDAIRWISWTHLSSVATSEVLRLLRPAYYAKGDDWRNRLPEGELAVCAETGTEVVFLDTVRDSSTAILLRYDGGEGAVE